MREHKFRAWDKLKKSMHEVAGINWVEGIVLLWKQTGSVRATYYAEMDSLELVEYTGLKDKNGKETYFDDLEKIYNCAWQVVWDEPCACVMLKRVSGEHLMKEIPAHNIPKGEVIGNIYENKELLEVI